jgi:GntR family transcriptional regulator / MocR family aminotransferase
LADYLGRVRGVLADPERTVVTNGYTHGLGLVCHALAEAGAKRIALEDPSNREDGLVAARAGLGGFRSGSTTPAHESTNFSAQTPTRSC